MFGLLRRPPMMVTQPAFVASTTLFSADLVPLANLSNSNTPNGPFHTIVFARLITSDAYPLSNVALHAMMLTEYYLVVESNRFWATVQTHVVVGNASLVIRKPRLGVFGKLVGSDEVHGEMQFDFASGGFLDQAVHDLCTKSIAATRALANRLPWHRPRRTRIYRSSSR